MKNRSVEQPNGRNYGQSKRSQRYIINVTVNTATIISAVECNQSFTALIMVAVFTETLAILSVYDFACFDGYFYHFEAFCVGFHRFNNVLAWKFYHVSVHLFQQLRLSCVELLYDACRKVPWIRAGRKPRWASWKAWVQRERRLPLQQRFQKRNEPKWRCHVHSSQRFVLDSADSCEDKRIR